VETIISLIIHATPEASRALRSFVNPGDVSFHVVVHDLEQPDGPVCRRSARGAIHHPGRAPMRRDLRMHQLVNLRILTLSTSPKPASVAIIDDPP
jgi:hypothetical protein